SDTKGAVVEVNSETDFVARNQQFQEFVAGVAALAVTNGQSVDAVKEAKLPSGETVDATLTNLIASIGENMTIRRIETLEVSQGVIGSYVHNQVVPNMGKIGVLVALESAADKAALETLA